MMFLLLSEAIGQSNLLNAKLPSDIGKKTAERLLLELKGKLAPDLGLGQNKSSKPDIVSEITQALLALGYSDKEAHLAVRQVPADVTVSDGIKLALKSLSKG